MATPEHAPTYRHDLEEALLTMTDSQTMRDAGINEQFARTYAKNAYRFDLLPEATRQRLVAQFSHMAREFSYADAVGRKHPESMQRQLAAWLKAVLVFAIYQTNHFPQEAAKSSEKQEHPLAGNG